MKLYLRSSLATNPPTAGEKSSAKPVGTFSGNSGTGFEDLALSTEISTSSTPTSVSLTSIAQTAHQDNYMGRWTSEALAAQTFGAGTWTIACALRENNNNANSFMVPTVYVWRPGTSSVVGYIYDSDTPIGSEWQANAVQGRVATFTGSDVTCQAGDVLVLEFWRHAEQGAATGYNQQLAFEQNTEVTEGVNNVAGSYINSPANITFGGAVVKHRRLLLGVGR